MVSWAAFGCGLIGGFVSIQQRIKNVNEEELDLLSRSWFQILLIPVYGGIFALVLYLAFLGGIVEGELFPRSSIPAFTTPYPTAEDVKMFLVSTYPSTGTDVAKLIFLVVPGRVLRASRSANNQQDRKQRSVRRNLFVH